MSSILGARLFLMVMMIREIKKIVKQIICSTLVFQIQFHHNDPGHQLRIIYVSQFQVQ